MKKNKGFTLIELLAVLVILAIIALIITPIISGVIKDARIKAAENATEGLLEAAKVYYGRQVMLNNGVFNDSQTQTIEFDGAAGGNPTGTVDGDTALEYSGFKVTDGSLTIDRYGKVQINPSNQLLINGYYCINNNLKVKCDEMEIDPEDVGIVKTAAELLVEHVVTSGDGLYADPNNAGEYYFRGANVNNHIMFGGVEWLIVGVTSNGEIKIIKRDVNSLHDWDIMNKRKTGFCSKSKGNSVCVAWAAMDYYSVGTESGEVTDDADINTYLNTTFKNTLSSVYDYVATDMTWNIGDSGYINSTYGANLTVEEMEEMEKEYTWTGDIALLTKSEYMRANTNDLCLDLDGLKNNKDTCESTNYLNNPDNNNNRNSWWLLSPSSGRFSYCYGTTGVKGSNYGPHELFTSMITQTYINSGVRPVIYLKSNIKLSGTGAVGDAYTIQGLIDN